MIENRVSKNKLKNSLVKIEVKVWKNTFYNTIRIIFCIFGIFLKTLIYYFFKKYIYYLKKRIKKNYSKI